MSGDQWLADGNIEVDIHQLQDFANHIKDELEKNFRPSFESGIAPMLRVQAPFGGGGLTEGKFFRSRHDESRSATAELLKEAMKGLASLSTAAMSIASEYANGDAFAHATNEQVLKAFDGTTEPTQADGSKVDGGKDGNTVDVSDDKKDPKNYRGFDSGGGQGTNSQYQQQDVGEGAGKYTIQGDDENMHDPNLAMPNIQH